MAILSQPDPYFSLRGQTYQHRLPVCINSVTCAGKDFGVVKAKYHLSQGALRLFDFSLAQALAKSTRNKTEVILVIVFTIFIPTHSRLHECNILKN